MPKTPTKIGKYPIISQIGEGAMGAVYKAMHPTLQKEIIIKKLTLTDNYTFNERFKREARILMELRNEHIVQVYDHFKEGSSFYIIMEFVDGIDLEKLIKSKRYLPADVAMLIFYEICRALQYAHDNNVIHRDIKPANILISREGNVKLVDFGVSTFTDDAEDDSLTKPGMTIGTPSYLAPEQISNAKNKNKRADIYAAGVVLYEMLTGKKPFKGSLTPELVQKIQKGKYLPPRKINPEIKRSTQRLIRKSMHFKPKRRFQDMSVILKKLSGFAAGYKNTENINRSIKNFIDGKEEDKKLKAGVFYRFVRAIPKVTTLLIPVVLLAGAAGWLYQQGYHYRYFYAEEYGAFQFDLKVKKGHKNLEELYIKPVLYHNTKKGLKQVKDISMELSQPKVKTAKKTSTIQLSSKPLFVKSGTYTFLLYVENEQFRESFFLKPLSVLEKGKKQSVTHQMMFKAQQQPPRLPVEISFKINDVHSGKQISNKDLNISIRRRGRWVDWNDFYLNLKSIRDFHSGARYKFRVDKEGYHKKYMNVTVRPEQTQVNLNINLIPVPGTYKIRSQTEGLSLMIDNKTRYISGGKGRQVKEIPTLKKNYQTVRLNPGTYYFTFKKNHLISDDISVTRKLKLKSGKLFLIDTEFSEIENRIKLNIQSKGE